MKVLAVLPAKKPVRMELDGSLESMQAFVGGAIQAIYPYEDPVAIVCHGEGKLLGLEYNRALRDETGAVYDILCGPFFLCGLGEEDLADLPEDLMDKYWQLFRRPELFVTVGGNLVIMKA